jgi:hypothetical protein
MKTKSKEIQDLNLGPTDRVFFHLFNNFSIFIKDPLQNQINLVRSLSDPHKLLRYSLSSARFYTVAKTPQLLSHWKALLEDSRNSNRHPFDELLRRHCEEMKGLAQDENNSELASAFNKLQDKFSKKDYKAPSQELCPDLEISSKSGRNLPCNF